MKPTTLDIARQLLKSSSIKKAEGEGTADPDPRAEGAAPTEEDLAAAKQEAQAGAQAGAEAGGEGGGEGGAPAGGDDAGAGAPAGAPGGGTADESGETTDDDSMEDKREVAKAITDLMKSSGLSWEEVGLLSAGPDLGIPVAKSEEFSGTEVHLDDPNAAFGADKAMATLNEILANMRHTNEVVAGIKGQLDQLAADRAALSDQVAKSEAAITDLGTRVDASIAKSSEAESRVAAVAGVLDALPRTAPAAAPKANTQPIMKSEVGNLPELPYKSHGELMKACFEGKVDPAQAPAFQRAITARLALAQ